MKKKFLSFFSNSFKYFDDMLLFIGITLIAFGVYQIYIPAGFIVLGICIIAFAFIFARSKEGDRS